MGDVSTAVSTNLEEAIAADPESSTGKTETTAEEKVATKTVEAPKKATTVPYERFQEVNSRMRELEEALETRESELSERSKALEKLATLVETKDKAASVLDQIRALYESGDPEWAPVLEKLDKKLKGIEEAVDEGEKTPEKAADEAHRVLKKTTEALASQLEDQKIDLIVQKADTLAAQYFAGLPEEYSDRDKFRIAHLLTEAINWEDVDASEDWASAIETHLPEAFQQVLDIYGDPEGIILKQYSESDKEKGETVETAPKSAEERLSTLLGKDYSGVKEVQTGKSKTLSPAISDADFSKALAEAMRASNEVLSKKR